MSYCRWSGRDFQSDVYVYDSDQGWVVHVAQNRIAWLAELPPPLARDASIEDRIGRMQAVSALLDDEANFVRVPIEHPAAGQTFIYDTPGECARALQGMVSEGFVVPQFAIDTLLEESDEIEEEVP